MGRSTRGFVGLWLALLLGASVLAVTASAAPASVVSNATADAVGAPSTPADTEGGSPVGAPVSPRNAVLRGSVAFSDGTPVVGACVDAVDTGFQRVRSSGRTADDGTFEVAVEAGPVQVQFGPCGSPPFFWPEWWDGELRQADAEVLDLAPGEVRAGLDVVLELPGDIDGVVTDEATGAPIAGACVSSDPGFETVRTSGTGFYHLRLVRPGPVAVRFQDCAGLGYAEEWFDGARSRVDATPVVVEEGRTTRADASLTRLGTLTGRVTVEGGAPLEGACVRALPVGSTDAFVESQFVLTDVSGLYRLALPPQAYRISFEACDTYPSAYQPEWFDDVPGGLFDAVDATPVEVRPDQETAGVDAELARLRPASVSGVVTAEDTGAPLEDVCVRFDGFPFDIEARTSPTGFYAVDLPPTASSWLVRFDPCSRGTGYIGEFYDDAYTFLDPIRFVRFESGEVRTGFDVSLARAAVLFGSVTDEVTGAPLPDVCVRADATTLFLGDVATSVTGFYALELPPALAIVSFSPCGDDLHLAETYDEQPLFGSTPTPVFLVSGVPRQLDESLRLGGAITGRARIGGEAAEVCVTAFDDSGQPAGSVVTQVSGTYRIGPLAPGGYRVHFSSCTSLAGAPEWWPATPGLDSDTDRGELVDVRAGEVVPGIDADLDPLVPSLLRGSVRLDDGTPVPGACVQLFDERSTLVVLSEPDGSFLFESVPPGRYRLVFSSCEGLLFATEYWEDATFEDATLLRIGPGETVDGIDARVLLTAPSEVPPLVAGVVTDAVTGAPLPDVCVSRSTGGAVAVTSPTGYYALAGGPGVSFARFTVRFQPCSPGSGYRTEWFDDAHSLDGATLLLPSFDTARADAQLERPFTTGSISGRVTDAEGSPLVGVCVAAAKGLPPKITRTDANGEYVFRGLSGSYTVRFAQCGGGSDELAWEFFGDTRLRSEATVLVIGAGTVREGVDAVLERWGSVSGTVLDDLSGKPFEGACVVGLTGTGELRYAIPSPLDGSYRIERIGRDGVRLAFGDCNEPSGHVAEYFGDAASLAETEVLVPEPGGELTGADASLARVPPGSAAGTVVRTRSG